MRRIDELTGLRAVAVGMVLLAHSGSGMPHVLAHNIFMNQATGDIGVQIFFVLSGYLITRNLLQEYAQTGRIGFWQFYRRRLYRITPAFYALILAVGGLGLLGVIRFSWQQLAVAAAYLWNYAPFLHLNATFASHPQGNWYLGHSWSLALEEQYYWAWPAAFLFIRRHNARWLLPGAILFVPILRMASYVLEPAMRPYLHMMFHTGIDTILVGCFLAMHQDALVARFARPLSSPFCLTAALALEFVLLNNLQARLGGFYIATYGATLGAAVIAFMMLAIMLQPRHWFCRLLRCPALLYVGTISYSLYLWQQLFDRHGMPTALVFPLDLLVPIGAAALSYHFIEQPFLRLKDRAARRPEAMRRKIAAS